MSKYSLKQNNSFNFTAINQQYDRGANSQLNIKISSTNRLLALLSKSATAIFDTSTKTQLYQINQPFKQVVFSLSDQFMYATDGSSLLKYTLKDHEATIIIPKSQTQIYNLRISSNNKLLYFVYNQSLYSYSFFNNKQNQISMMLQSKKQCQIQLFQIDEKALRLVTASYDCYICSYGIKSGVYELSNSIFVDQCRSNQLALRNQQVILTQNIILLNPQIIILNDKLQLKKRIIQQANNSYIFINLMRNYIISYGRGDDYLWIYLNDLSFFRQKIALGNHYILDAEYNHMGNQIYLALYSAITNLYHLKSYKMAFNCSGLKYTANQQNNFDEYQQRCLCENGYLFSGQKIQCQINTCANLGKSLDEQCSCNKLQIYEQFTATCKLDCNQIYKAVPSIIQNMQYCYCLQPLCWNSQTKDCNLIDCSLIANSISKWINYSCVCQVGYLWVEGNLTCTFAEHVPVVEEANSYAWVIFILILIASIIVSTIVCWYKTFRKSPQDYPKVYKIEEGNVKEDQKDTDRHLEDNKNQVGHGNNLQIDSDIKSKRISMPISSEKLSINEEEQNKSD